MRRSGRRFGGWKKSLLIGSGLGVLFLAGLIWFVSNVYSPFMEDVADLRVLLPEDCDFLIEARDFPTLVKGVEDATFYASLDRNEEFQNFLQSPEVRSSPAVRQLKKAFEQAASDKVALPAGIEFLGGVTGSQIVLGGYAPKTPGADPVFLLVVKPGDWKVIAGANVLLHETLCGWFVDGRINVKEIRHTDPIVELDVDVEGKPTTFALARIHNALMIGNDPELVRTRAIRLRQDGLPFAPEARFRPDWVWDGGEETSIQILARRQPFEDQFEPRRTILRPAFGLMAQPLESYFPHFEGEDLAMRAIVGDAAEFRFSIGCRGRNPVDLPTRMHPVDKVAVQRQIDDILKAMPPYTFAYFYQNASPGDLLAYLCNEPKLFNTDQKKLWFETAVERLPRFKGVAADEKQGPALLPALVRELRAAFHNDVGIVAFKQQRLQKIVSSAPGVAVVMHIKDRQYLQRFIDEIGASIDPKVQAFEFYDDDRLKMWHIIAKGLVNNREVTDPGFAILGDWFIFTNWFRMLTDMQGVLKDPVSGFTARSEVLDDLQTNLADMPPGASAFAFVDAEQLFEFFDDAKDAWVEERASISDAEKVTKRLELEREATEKKIPADQRQRYSDAMFQAWIQQLTGTKNPQKIRAEIETKLRYFRTALRWTFLSYGVEGGTFNGVIRLKASSR